MSVYGCVIPLQAVRGTKRSVSESSGEEDHLESKVDGGKGQKKVCGLLSMYSQLSTVCVCVHLAPWSYAHDPINQRGCVCA